MNTKNFSEDREITLKEIKENRINHHLSLRKKEFYKIISNKRKLFQEIDLLMQNSTNIKNSSDLCNSNIFKLLTNEQILEEINKIQKQKLIINNNFTEISQCLLSLDFQLSKDLLNSINFIAENKIYIFLIEFIGKIFNSTYEENLNNINNLDQLVNKALQILFKYSSNKDDNSQMINYILQNNRINIFNQIILSFGNNNSQSKIILNNTKKTDILLFTIIILHNLSIESQILLSTLQNMKIDENLISIINNKKNSININDNNIVYFILFFSLDKDIKNREEDFIINICDFLNKKGITSSSLKAQEISLNCLCNITSIFESEKLYKNMIYSGIFDNILKIIKTSKEIYPILVGLKIVNNILTEENININYFIKSNLFLSLISIIINFDKNIEHLTPDLLHHIISIFLYLTKSSLFYHSINNNLNFVIILVELIGQISNQVTHDILTFINMVINESYRISQKIIFNNKELVIKLINLIKEECHNYKIVTMSAIILSKILRHIDEYNDEENEDKNNNFNFKEYVVQIKSVIEIKLLNENSLNQNIVKVFKAILGIINEKNK